MTPEDTWPARGRRHEEATSEVVSVDVTTGERTKHTEDPGLKVSPQYLEAGRIGYLMKSGEASRLVFTDGKSGPSNLLRNPAWSPDGAQVVFHRPSFGDRQQNQTLFSPDPAFQLAWSEIFPAFSRDGRLVVSAGRAVIEREGVGETRGLALVDSGGEYRPVFYEEGSWAFEPSWSPDGERIVVGLGSFFGERDEGSARIISVRADGSEMRGLTEGPPNSGFPSFSPDGDRIVYRVWGGGQRGLRVLDLEEGSTATLTEGYDNFPAWSPEGEHLLFSSGRLGFRDEAPLYDGVPQPHEKVFIMEADGSFDLEPLSGRVFDARDGVEVRKFDN